MSELFAGFRDPIFAARQRHADAGWRGSGPTQMTPVASYIHDMSAELKFSTQFGGA